MPTVEFMNPMLDPDANIWLQQTLDQFGEKNYFKVKSIQYGWGQMWRELVSVGISRRGPDLAEVGTTWMESLVAMNALRPFPKNEVDAIGGEAAFMPSSWMSTSVGGDRRVWGIPFRADVRVIFYWKDMAEKAGVDPEKDFSSATGLHQVFKVLRSVAKYPWAAASTAPGDHNMVYNAASWVWAKGGDFTSIDGKSAAFTSPEAIEGLCDFFRLQEFMPPGALLSDVPSLEMFARREIAAFIGGPWILPYLPNNHSSKELLPLLGVALPPGPPFVGGTLLVVWQHSHMDLEALELIRYLCAPDIQAQFSPQAGGLSVRVESWAETMQPSELYQVLNNALTLGRPLPQIRLWGLIEEKLAVVFDQVRVALDEDPTANIEKMLRAELIPLAEQIDNMLSS